MGALRVSCGPRAEKIGLQSVEISLESGEEQPGVFLSDSRKVDVLEQIGGEVEEVVLKTQEILVLVDGGVRSCHSVSIEEGSCRMKECGKDEPGRGEVEVLSGHVTYRQLGAST